MNYYLREGLLDDTVDRTAWSKAPNDVEQILTNSGLEVINGPKWHMPKKGNRLIKLIKHNKLKRDYIKALCRLKKGDFLFMQYPHLNHTIFMGRIMKDLKKRGVYTVVLIHDLMSHRPAGTNPIKMRREEEKEVMSASYLIVHNHHMKEVIQKDYGYPKKQMVSLELFDYLSDEQMVNNETYKRYHSKDSYSVNIAGSLAKEKAGYIYDLPEDVCFYLYGAKYEGEEKDNILYRGSFMAGELPRKLEGDFGLVWDGFESETCVGEYGEYLKMNNPHKTSLYLAAGIPVVVWKEAAIADFVLKEGVGIPVESLKDLNDVLSKVSKDEYRIMRDNAMKISQKVRTGFYTKQAVERVYEG